MDRRRLDLTCLLVMSSLLVLCGARRQLLADERGDQGTFSVSIGSSSGDKITSEPMTLFVADFGRKITTQNPLSLFTISGSGRVDVLYIQEVGMLYVLASVSNMSVPTLMEFVIPEGVTTDDQGAKNDGASEYASYAPSSGYPIFGYVVGWVMFATAILSLVAASITPNVTVGVGLVNFVGFVQVLYMIGNLPLTNMPWNYRQASQALDWVGLNPSIGPINTDYSIGSQSEVYSTLADMNTRFPYIPVRIRGQIQGGQAMKESSNGSYTALPLPFVDFDNVTEALMNENSTIVTIDEVPIDEDVPLGQASINPFQSPEPSSPETEQTSPTPQNISPPNGNYISSPSQEREEEQGDDKESPSMPLEKQPLPPPIQTAPEPPTPIDQPSLPPPPPPSEKPNMPPPEIKAPSPPPPYEKPTMPPPEIKAPSPPPPYEKPTMPPPEIKAPSPPPPYEKPTMPPAGSKAPSPPPPYEKPTMPPAGSKTPSPPPPIKVFSPPPQTIKPRPSPPPPKPFALDPGIIKPPVINVPILDTVKQRRRLLIVDPVEALGSSGFSYTVVTATPDTLNNINTTREDLSEQDIGSSVFSRIRTIENAGNVPDADQRRLDLLWNVLFWSAMALLATLLLHVAALVFLRYRNVTSIPKMLQIPRIELIVFMFILPMICAAGCACLQSTSAGVLAAGACLGVILPFGFLILVSLFLVYCIIRPDIEKRRALYLVHKECEGNMRMQSNSDTSSNHLSQSNNGSEIPLHQDAEVPKETTRERAKGVKHTILQVYRCIYKRVISPLFGFSSPRRAGVVYKNVDASHPIWHGPTEKDVLLVKRFGCFFEDAHGPRVLQMSGEMDGKPSLEKDDIGVENLAYIASEHSNNSVEILQTFGVLFALTKLMLFAAIINAAGGVNKVGQVVVLMLISLLHIFYLRYFVPYRLRLELAAEIVASICDLAVFICGIVLIAKDVWTTSEGTNMGIAMLVLQATGFFVFITVRVGLALRTMSLTLFHKEAS